MLSLCIGVVYEMSFVWLLYVNIVYLFWLNNGVDVGGCVFDFEKGYGYEVGVKWVGVCWFMIVLVFYVIKCNVFIVDLVNVGFLCVVGEVCSCGVEFEWSGDFGYGLCGFVNFVYVDVEVMCDVVFMFGLCFVDVLWLSGSVLLMYEMILLFVDKVGVGVGVIYVGCCVGNMVNM